jgi:hypothetical protein
MERTPLQSKKFIAFLVSEFTWKAIVMTVFIVFRDEISLASNWLWWFLVTVVIVAGFLEVGYIVGQAGLDLFVRGIGLVSDATSKVWGKHGGDEG